MHIVILLIVVIAAITFLLMNKRKYVEPTDLSSLDLRDFKDAIAAPKAISEGQILAWSICFLENNPELDLAGITSFLQKKWGIASNTSSDDSSVQRVVTFGNVRLTFEPILMKSGSLLPDQLIPGGTTCVPEQQIGCILVTASTPTGGAAASLGLSQAILALLATCRQVSGVYWMSSELILKRSVAERKLTTNYKKFEWPVDVWISSHAFKDESGAVIGYTVGLGKIGGTDFEAVNAKESPKDLEDRLDGVARYVVNHFGQIQNGDTMGVDEKEKIRLKKTPSETIHRGWVFQLQYERS
tara:strand:- start:23536 stop:24432 length:897 start_codon:yes stop_codon:yes gene_type:complete